jgi:MFS family permease
MDMETELSARRRRWLLGTLLTGQFMAQADVTVVNVATPSIHASLGASGAALQLVVDGYLITLAALLITGARVGHLYGFRNAFGAGVSLFTLASLACGLAPDPVVLIVARALQGAGAALMYPQTLTGIQRFFTGAERVRAMGKYAMALSAGAVTGQILGGVLVSANIAGLGWRAVFLVNVPVGAAALAATIRLPAGGRRHASLDLAGVALLSFTVLLIVVPLTLGRSQGWPVWSWVCLAASVPAGAGFAAAENRVAARGGEPLLNLRLLTAPAIRWGLLALTTATGSYYVLLFSLAQYLQGGLGWSPVMSGLVLVPWVAAFGLAGTVVRRLPGRRLLPAAGCLLLAVAYAGIGAVAATGQHGAGLLLPLLAAGGLGLGINFVALLAAMTGAVPPRYAPDVSGVISTMLSIGGAIAVATAGSIYLSLARSASHPGMPPGHAFGVTSVVLASIAVLAAMAARLTVRQESEGRPPGTQAGQASTQAARSTLFEGARDAARTR